MTAQTKPNKQDVSRADRAGDYSYKKAFYQSQAVAEDYNFHRWGTPERAERNLRKWKTILQAISMTDGIRTILDAPCGTGRFIGRLAECGFEMYGTDISTEMMQVARSGIGDVDGIHGYVRADAEFLPFGDGAFDCVMSIRFFFHIDAATRVRILREMGRVSRRWLIIDYRHRYNYRYAVWRTQRALGLTEIPLDRVDRAQLEQEFSAAGLRVLRILPVTRLFSDKWIVLCEKIAPTSS